MWPLNSLTSLKLNNIRLCYHVDEHYNNTFYTAEGVNALVELLHRKNSLTSLEIHSNRIRLERSESVNHRGHSRTSSLTNLSIYTDAIDEESAKVLRNVVEDMMVLSWVFDGCVQ